jgi:hypothetical protein
VKKENTGCVEDVFVRCVVWWGEVAVGCAPEDLQAQTLRGTPAKYLEKELE